MKEQGISGDDQGNFRPLPIPKSSQDEVLSTHNGNVGTPSYFSAGITRRIVHPINYLYPKVATEFSKQNCICFRPLVNIVRDFRKRLPAPIRYFMRVRIRRAIECASEHVYNLMFDEAVGLLGTIFHHKKWRQSGGYPHLFGKSARRGIVDVFFRTRMAAAGVRPASCGMIFGSGALMEKKTILSVMDNHRNCAMTEPALVGKQLGRAPDNAIILID